MATPTVPIAPLLVAAALPVGLIPYCFLVYVLSTPFSPLLFP